MAQKKQNIPSGALDSQQDRFQQRVGETVERFRDEMPRRTNQFLILALVIVAIAGAIFYNQKTSQASARAEAEQLGAALVHNYSGDWQQERQELEKFLATNPKDLLTRAKAELLLGNIAYRMGDYDQAESQFRSSAKNSGKTVLIASAARHGLASTLMQREEWQKAATEWEQFVSDYGKRRGTARDQVAGKDGAEESALVPDALYKLAVVQLKLDQKEKAKVTCERIVRSYSDSRIAGQAERLLVEL